MVDGFGRATQRALCTLKPGHEVDDPHEPRTEQQRAHQGHVWDSDDNSITVTPAGGAEIYTLHMVSTRPAEHPFYRGKIEATCRCTWNAYGDDQTAAEQAGTDHLRAFNGLQTER
jgi:hypothetical protein